LPGEQTEQLACSSAQLQKLICESQTYIFTLLVISEEALYGNRLAAYRLAESCLLLSCFLLTAWQYFAEGL